MANARTSMIDNLNRLIFLAEASSQWEYDLSDFIDACSTLKQNLANTQQLNNSQIEFYYQLVQAYLRKPENQKSLHQTFKQSKTLNAQYRDGYDKCLAEIEAGCLLHGLYNNRAALEKYQAVRDEQNKIDIVRSKPSPNISYHKLLDLVAASLNAQLSLVNGHLANSSSKASLGDISDDDDDDDDEISTYDDELSYEPKAKARGAILWDFDGVLAHYPASTGETTATHELGDKYTDKYYIPNIQQLELTLDILSDNNFLNIIASQRLAMSGSSSGSSHKLQMEAIVKIICGDHANRLNLALGQTLATDVKKATDLNDTKVPYCDIAKEYAESVTLVDDNSHYQTGVVQAGYSFIHVNDDLLYKNPYNNDDNKLLFNAYLYEVLLSHLSIGEILASIETNENVVQATKDEFKEFILKFYKNCTAVCQHNHGPVQGCIIAHNILTKQLNLTPTSPAISTQISSYLSLAKEKIAEIKNNSELSTEAKARKLQVISETTQDLTIAVKSGNLATIQQRHNRISNRLGISGDRKLYGAAVGVCTVLTLSAIVAIPFTLGASAILVGTAMAAGISLMATLGFGKKLYSTNKRAGFWDNTSNVLSFAKADARVKSQAQQHKGEFIEVRGDSSGNKKIDISFQH